MRKYIRLNMLLALLLAAAALLPGRIALGGDRPNADRLEDATDMLIDDILDEADIRCHDDDDDDDELELETLKFFIEFNETDEDIGVQCVLGGEPYKWLRAYDPDERRILDLRPRRILKRQGMSDFFFESAEPPLDEFSIDDFLDRFPEGEYEFETITLDGEEQDGEAEFTHDIPAGPVITCPLEGDVVDPDDVYITWDPVTMTTAYDPPQRPVNIVGYQVIVTLEEPLREFLVDLPADVTAVSVPPEFFEEGEEYELEILAVEESDNQTISIIFFETED